MNTVLSTILALIIRAANNPSVQAAALKASRIATRAAIKAVSEILRRKAIHTKKSWSN